MCQQCESSAVEVIENILPGYSIYQSKAPSKHWPEGHYGLVACNDPEFTWDGVPPVSDEILATDSPCVQRAKVLQDAALVAFTKRSNITMDPMSGWRFVEACIEAGYDAEKHGANVVMWFFDRVGRRLRAVVAPE